VRSGADSHGPVVRGRSFVMVRGCYAGDLDEGELLMDHWRDWCTPEIDLFGPLPFVGDEVAARLAQLKAELDPDDLFDRGLDLRGENP
jgi:hypothetical protein